MLATNSLQLRHPAAGTSSWQPSSIHNDDSVQLRDDTLARITSAANDVEMLEPANAGPTLYLVLDTNVLIDNLNVIRAFSEDLDRIALPWAMKIVVPYVVLSELDGLKNREGLSWFARTASTFLLQKVKEKKSLKVQARSETVNTQLQEHEQLRSADIAIWDCCMYYKTKGEVVLLTNDTNLRTLCENEEPVIPTVAPGRRLLSSRELAAQLFGDNINVTPFRASENAPRYRPTRSQQTQHLARTEGPGAADDDGMEVDDDAGAAAADDWVPSHALDGLHIQIIDHFSAVLMELAARVRHEARDDGPPHAIAARARAPPQGVSGVERARLRGVPGVEEAGAQLAAPAGDVPAPAERGPWVAQGAGLAAPGVGELPERARGHREAVWGRARAAVARRAAAPRDGCV